MKRIAALVVALAIAAPVAGAPLIGEVGPDTPPMGRSAFSEIFADGVPFPFSAILDELRAAAGAGEVQTALIPLGRSLQRFSADPEYFASPRLVVAVTGERAGPGDVLLANRLYLGYQPAAEVIEAISYNEEAGRFEFEEVIGYVADSPRRIEPATRSICAACHQGLSPIFARPLWSETNANSAVAARLEGLGDTFHGAPVRQNVDAIEAFDVATDAAARIALANRLWDEGCADPGCRAALLNAALAYALSGARPDWRASDGGTFSARVATLWPGGLSTPSFDLPNRDPIPLLASNNPETVIETNGTMNPETPRPLVTLWPLSEPPFEAAAREIASLLSSGDLALIDGLLRKSKPVDSNTHDLACRTTAANRPLGGTETRFDCAGMGVVTQGHLAAAGRGRVDLLHIEGAPALRNLNIEGDRGDLTQSGGETAARLADGRRVAELWITPPAGVVVVDDFTPLAIALDRRAQSGDPAFGSGPFRRRAVLTSILNVLEKHDD